MLRSPALLLLLALTLVVAGCTGGDADEQEVEAPTEEATEQAAGGGNDAEAQARLADAAEATRAAGTARFTMSVAGGDQPGQQVAEGAEDFAAERRRITFSGGQGELEAVVDGTETYVAVPFLEDAQWVRMELSELGAAGGLSGPVGLPLQDPGGALDLVGDAAGDVQEVGGETIDGTDTRQYAVTVDLAEAAAQADAAAGSDARTALAQAGVETLAMDVWVDDDDLIRRVAYTLETEPTEVSAGDASVQAGGPVTATFDYSAFGEPVDITVPSGGGVLDIDEDTVRDRLQDLTGGGGR